MKRKPTAPMARKEMTFLAAAVCTALRASAADPSDTSPTLEAVTVTAERRSESIQEVPLSVTAISGDTLDKFDDICSTTFGTAGSTKESRTFPSATANTP